jgi:hypothetical protein
MTIGLSPRLRLVKPGVYIYWCPGCMAAHQFNISSSDHPSGMRWGFDGDLKNPSVEPELMVLNGATVCRHVLRAGKLHFADDCTHALADQVVELPHFPLP